MKELSRIQSLSRGLLVVLLFAVPSTSFSQVVVTRLGSLGGSSDNTYDLNNTGQAVGNALTTGNLEQHAALFQNGTAIDLHTLGGTSASAQAINDQGRVAGFSSTLRNLATHAFWFDGTMHDLGTLGGTISGAVDINDLGQVAGNSYLSGNIIQHAFRYSGGALQDLGTLGGGYSSAIALNSQGVVVGESTLVGEMDLHAFRYTTLMVDLGTLGGTYSSAQAVNNAGWVVGNSTLLFDVDQHAFLHDGTTMIDLGALGGNYSTAYDVNNAGWVIGDATTLHDAEYHGFVYGAGVLVDLHTLGGDYSSTWDLNQSGQIVGESTTASGSQRAFLWENGVMTDLNTVLPPNSGWLLTSAQFINDAGDIVGVGSYQGHFDWFLLHLGAANHPPAANAGPDQVVECAGNSTAVVLDGTASSDPDGDALVYTWSAGGAPLASGPHPTVALPTGQYQLTLTVRDPAGESSQDTVTVTVQDTTAPAVSHGPVSALEADDACHVALPDLRSGAVATDQCSPTASLMLTQSPAPGTQLGLGTHTVTITATDPAGNHGQCVVQVEVVDRQPPVVSHGPVAALEVNAACAVALPDLRGGAVASDQCSPASSLVLAQSPAPGTQLGLGIHTITITATDPAGNQGQCSVQLEVVDRQPPVVSHGPVAALEVNAACAVALPDLRGGAVASDQCSPASSLVLAQSPAPGTQLGLGIHTITITATDPAGNQGQCSVQVRWSIVARPWWEILSRHPQNSSRPITTW
jgi:probable HAF family extracellular repeat protein